MTNWFHATRGIGKPGSPAMVRIIGKVVKLGNSFPGLGRCVNLCLWSLNSKETWPIDRGSVDANLRCSMAMAQITRGIQRVTKKSQLGINVVGTN